MSKKTKAEDQFEIIKTMVKRNEHPNTWKYPGRSGNEHKMALIKFMPTLSKEQMNSFALGNLVVNEVAAKKFIYEVKVNDLVGIKDTLYRVVGKTTDSLEVEFAKRNEPTTRTIGLSDIDYGLSTGFAEILWRDDAPYGIDSEEEVSIYIPKQKKVKASKSTKKTEKKE